VLEGNVLAARSDTLVCREITGLDSTQPATMATDSQGEVIDRMAGKVLRFGRVDYRNDGRVVGIKTEDRFSHIYIIGKTGTGKSTLIETMALQDLESGRGFALVDPGMATWSSGSQIGFPHSAKPT
jgi:DNA helicase HerA-like ATPase